MRCKFLSECLFVGDGCKDVSSEEDCDELARKEKLSLELCPIMKKLGYKPKLCRCNIFFVRALLPANMKCYEGNKCISAIIPELQPIIKHCLNNKRERLIMKPHLTEIQKLLPIHTLQEG